MRKILFSLFALALLVGYGWSADEKTLVSTGASVNYAVDGQTYDLHTANSVSSTDTIATTKMNVYGPYDLTNCDRCPPAAGFHLYWDAITGTTPTAAFGYQLLPGTDISDTTSTWTLVDTISATPGNAYWTFTGTGESVVFLVDNYDGTETQIPGRLRVKMKPNITYSREKR